MPFFIIMYIIVTSVNSNNAGVYLCSTYLLFFIFFNWETRLASSASRARKNSNGRPKRKKARMINATSEIGHDRHFLVARERIIARQHSNWKNEILFKNCL